MRTITKNKTKKTRKIRMTRISKTRPHRTYDDDEFEDQTYVYTLNVCG